MGSWDTRETTGLLHDVDVWVERAYFGTDAEYDDGNTTLLIMEGTKKGPDVDPEDSEFRQFFSTGSKWEHREGGKKAVHEDGSEEFHASCGYARFFRAVLELSDDAAKALQGRGYPDNAEIWVGLGFHLERTKVDFGPPLGEKEVLLPTEYLGDNQEGGAVKKEASSKDKAKAAIAKAKAASKGGGDDDGQRKELVALAKTFDTHDEFVMAAYDKWPEVEGFDEFTDMVDENGTIWTEAKA